MSDQASSPASTSSTTASPAQAPARPQGAPEAGAAPSAGAASPVNRQALRSALKRTESIREREANHQRQVQELERQRTELAPLLEAQGLLKEGRGAEAMRRLTGGADADLIKLYESMTPDVAGLDRSDKALGALPAHVREQLARLPDLEKRAAQMDDLASRLSAIETTRDSAISQVQERHQQQVLEGVFTSGMDAMLERGGEAADLIASMPKGRERLLARWDQLLGERAEEITALPVEHRAQALSGLVGEAAKALHEDLKADLGGVLRLPPSRGKMYGTRAGSPPARAARAPDQTQAPAPSTSGKTSAPRTVMPSSLGEPDGVDWRRLTPQQRVDRLAREERAALRTHKPGR